MRAREELLVERDGVLESIAVALDRAARGSGGVVFVEGPAGIGKSRVLAAASTAARARGGRVLRARGGELERDITFGIARQLFERELRGRPDAEREALLGGSARLAAAAIGLDPSPPDFSPETGPLNGLYWLAANLAEPGPLLLVVDDAHWADEESLRFLTYLARRLDGLRILVLVGARPRDADTRSDVLELLVGEAGARHLTLPPLTPVGAGQVLAARLGRSVDAELADVCREVTGGSPFFIEELASALAGEPAGPPLLVRARELVPATVRHTVLLRVRREGSDAQAAAVALAVLGDHASSDLVARLTQRPAPATSAALDRLLDAGVVTWGERPGLAHPILRTAIYEDVPEVERRRLHARAAGALEQQGAPAEEVAQHLLHTEPGGRAEVAAALAAAGHRALDRGASEAAQRLLARALAERAGTAPPPELLMDLAVAAHRAGDLPDAARHLRELLAGELGASTRTRGVLMLSRVVAELDGEPAAIAELQAAVGRLGGDDALRVDVEQCSLALYVPEQSAATRPRLAAYVALAGDTPAERVALAVTAYARAIDPDGVASEVVEIATRALGDGRLLMEETSDSPIVEDVLHALEMAEALDQHDAAVQQGFADARARGSAFGFFMHSLAALTSAVLRGDTGVAVTHGEAALRTLPDLSDRLLVAFWTSSVRRFVVEALVHRGELARARELAKPSQGPAQLELREHGRYAQARLLAAGGEHERALYEFEAYGAFASRAGWEGRECPWRLHAALSLGALGRREEAQALTAESLAIAQRWGAPGGIGEAQRIHALVGDPADAVAGLRTAVATLRGAVTSLVLADALVDLGVALRREGGVAEAQDALSQGRRLALRCEAFPLADRARDELSLLRDARPVAPPAAALAELGSPSVATLERQGAVWRVQFGGAPFFATDTKGMDYLARLLARPGVEIPASELAAPGAAGPGGLDAAVRADFGERLRELDAELEEARAYRDPERVAGLERERVALARELAAAIGVAAEGKSRGSASERARVNVTRALRASIARLGEHDRALARHLEATVRTGSACVHRAELGATRWRVSP